MRGQKAEKYRMEVVKINRAVNRKNQKLAMQREALEALKTIRGWCEAAESRQTQLELLAWLQAIRKKCTRILNKGELAKVRPAAGLKIKAER